MSGSSVPMQTSTLAGDVAGVLPAGRSPSPEWNPTTPRGRRRRGPSSSDIVPPKQYPIDATRLRSAYGLGEQHVEPGAGDARVRIGVAGELAEAAP